MKKWIAAAAIFVTAVLAPVSARADFSFADVEEVEFYFASGVGGWDTHLTISGDGSFAGNYHDSDMGDTGEGYPDGTLYYCDFTGSFTRPEKVDDYTCVFKLDRLEFANTPDTQEIIGQVLYRYSEAYGLDNAGDFYLYLPGKPIGELPEEYLEWVRYSIPQEESTVLPFYGLYNENAKEGFSGHRKEASYIDQRTAQAEEEGAALAEELNEGNLPQQQLNMKSYELFQVWDNALNDIWSYLKDTLDAETMEALTEEELAWIEKKEADVAAQGAEFEGGSMQPFIMNTAAYRWTKERVYELQNDFD